MKYSDKKGIPHWLTEWYMERVKYPISGAMIEAGEWINRIDHKSGQVLFNSAWVYVFYNYDTGLCKIGVTESLDERLSTLNSQSGSCIDAVICIDLEPGYDEKKEYLEKELHLFFSAKRIKGEWFKLDIKDIIAIKNLFWEIEGQDIEDNIKDVLEYSKIISA